MWNWLRGARSEGDNGGEVAQKDMAPGTASETPVQESSVEKDVLAAGRAACYKVHSLSALFCITLSVWSFVFGTEDIGHQNFNLHDLMILVTVA